MMPPGVHMFTTSELCILAGIVVVLIVLVSRKS